MKGEGWELAPQIRDTRPGSESDGDFIATNLPSSGQVISALAACLANAELAADQSRGPALGDETLSLRRPHFAMLANADFQGPPPESPPEARSLSIGPATRALPALLRDTFPHFPPFPVTLRPICAQGQPHAFALEKLGEANARCEELSRDAGALRSLLASRSADAERAALERDALRADLDALLTQRAALDAMKAAVVRALGGGGGGGGGGALPGGGVVAGGGGGGALTLHGQGALPGATTAIL
eukprot:366530-Chlamydomonas_euryale.AAC.2